MLTPLSALSSKIKYKVDFALVPFAIVLIEFAVFISQLPSNHHKVGDLALLRITHLALMLLGALLVSKSFIKLKKREVPYLTLAVVGVVFIALGDLLHIYMAGLFNIELISGYRRAAVIIFEGAIWFPAFQIIAGNRLLILESFKDYERRLVIASRSRIRTSRDFKVLQNAAQDQIKRELIALCDRLRARVMKVSDSDSRLIERNIAIAPALLGEDFRTLAMKLEHPDSKRDSKSFLKKNLSSLKILLQQFRILYASAVEQTPLSRREYILILFALSTPLYIYFSSPLETLVSVLILFVLIIAFTTFISSLQGTNFLKSRAILSLLLFVAGVLPFLANLIAELISSKYSNRIPLIITVAVLPTTYFILVKLYQVLRPSALALLQKDELRAGVALQARVSKIVSDDSLRNISHQWAIYIHGKILTRLAATSLKLETAAAHGDREMFNGALLSLNELLSAPAQDFESKSRNLEDEVTYRLNPWKGLLIIDLHIDSNLNSVENPRVRDVGEVIEELISNSIRHGKAKKIELKLVRVDDHFIEIVSRDNATVAPPEGQHRLGLGTRIFNLASDGRWSITREDSSTHFRLLIEFES